MDYVNIEDYKDVLVGDSRLEPGYDLSRKELQEILKATLRTLRERERVVIVLYYFRNYTYEQIAGVIGLKNKYHIGNIIKKSLKRLQHPSRSRFLRSWFKGTGEEIEYVINKADNKIKADI